MDKRIIAITGASSGIGRALALSYAGEGNHLILAALGQAELEKTAEACREKGSETTVIEFDLSKPESVKSFTDSIAAKHNHLDRLIHVSGISQRSRAEEAPIDVDRKIMEINYFGAIEVTKNLLPLLKASKSAKIGVTSSISGKFGFPLRSAYAASKFALHGFFESLRLEHYKDNISVTIMCPGRVNTPISLSALNAQGKAQGVMDPGQANGIPVEKCAAQMKRAIEKNKKEVFIGGKEILMVYFKKFIPPLFYKIARKTNPT
ncbi:MAG TPA: SDR family oxidoreductase [Salinivirga sp.]|uniref:SDR family oxidoreductase n=1 Tax=Salinivirga sp. TaxID=1970192 RepID=UPI002B47ED16|nr:SDR family oxidoreductase [Salinivirga sp.]HKK60682.1 SDR family oxidoreductase [Salinivirga sp.]